MMTPKTMWGGGGGGGGCNSFRRALLEGNKGFWHNYTPPASSWDRGGIEFSGQIGVMKFCAPPTQLWCLTANRPTIPSQASPSLFALNNGRIGERGGQAAGGEAVPPHAGPLGQWWWIAYDRRSLLPSSLDRHINYSPVMERLQIWLILKITAANKSCNKERIYVHNTNKTQIRNYV